MHVEYSFSIVSITRLTLKNEFFSFFFPREFGATIKEKNGNQSLHDKPNTIVTRQYECGRKCFENAKCTISIKFDKLLLDRSDK